MKTMKTAYAQRQMDRLSDRIIDMIALCDDMAVRDDIPAGAKTTFNNIGDELKRLEWQAHIW